MTTKEREQEIAILESAEAAAEDAYFAARPHLDGTETRKMFEEGFCRGWLCLLRLAAANEKAAES